MAQTAWPGDVDGDVFRRMQSSGFDFETPIDIDFDVDFDAWPPADEFLDSLREQFSKVKTYPPAADGDGYVQFAVHAPLTYELVMFIQSTVSELASPFGGVCESWGALQQGTQESVLPAGANTRAPGASPRRPRRRTWQRQHA